MTYTFGEARKDAERIENFLKRLAKAQEIFGLVSAAEVKLAELERDAKAAEAELKKLKTRYTAAKTLTDDKVAALGAVEATARHDAVLAQQDARDVLDALATEVKEARAEARRESASSWEALQNLLNDHAERVKTMETVEAAKRAQIAEAETQRRALIKQLSPED